MVINIVGTLFHLSCPLTDNCTDTALLHVFFFLSQMTEQRKNKQRLGFLGPPQVNHHIPTHWEAPDSMVATPGPLNCRAHASPRIPACKTMCTQIGLKKSCLYCETSAVSPTETAPCINPEWQAALHHLCHLRTPSYRQTQLCEWLTKHSTHLPVWC